MKAIRAPDEARLNGPQTTGREYRGLSQPEHQVREERSLRVPMRDGVDLMADVLRPDAPGRFPALVAASPYPRQIQNSGAPLGFVEAGTSSFFVPRGYAHVIANVRGTGGSGGEYAFFGAVDQADMHDLVEWAAAQPWCDGNVGMVGISAFAMAQLAAAVAAPPHLRAIFPVAATIDLYGAMYHGGLLNASFLGGWLRALGNASRVNDRTLRRLAGLGRRLFRHPTVHPRLAGINGEAVLSMLRRVMPARALPHPWDDLFDAIAIEHQARDAFWAERDLTPLLGNVRVPAYLGCDWENVPLHLPATFAALAALPQDVPVRVALMNHGGLTWPWESFHVEALAWFDLWLKGRDTGVMEGDPIRYQVPGAGEAWRETAVWPPRGVRPMAVRLGADGSLAASADPAGSRAYTCLPSTLPARPSGGPGALPSSLTWQTAPLAADLELAGPFVLELDAVTTAPDTAWIAVLQDVAPSGRAESITAGWQRAGACRRVVPGELACYRLRLVDNARRLPAGHRLRLVLRSDDSAGEPVLMGFRHAPLGLPCRNTVHASSQLLIPVLGEGGGRLTGGA